MNVLEKKTYKREGRALAYYEGGQGDTILFIQGGGISARTYAKPLELLVKKYHVLAPDLFGFGLSDLPEKNWTFVDYIEYLRDFIKDKGSQNIIVIGHSLGGRIALSFAASEKKTRKLILVDSSPLANYYKSKKNRLLSLITRTTQEMLISRHPAFLIIMRDFLKNVVKHHIKYIHIRKIVNASLQVDNGEAQKIRIPTLILWGDKDLVISSKEAYTLQEEIPNSIIKIVKGNHSWPLTNPELFASEVANFITHDS